MAERYRYGTNVPVAPVGRPQASGLSIAAEGLHQAASAAQRLALDRVEEKRLAFENASLNSARSELETRGAELELQLQKEAGPGGDGYVANLRAAKEKLRAEIWAKVPGRVQQSETAQAAWNDIFTADDISTSRSATVWQAAQEKTFARASISDVLNGLAAKNEANPSAAGIRETMEDWGRRLAGYRGLLSAEDLAAEDRNGKVVMTIATVRGLAKQGKFAEARQLVEKVAGQVDIQDRAALDATIEQEENKDRIEKARQEAERAKRQQLAANGLEVAILKGEAFEADVDAAVKAGRISLNDQPPLIRAAREEMAARQRAALVSQAFANGLPLDPYDSDVKKGVDKQWLLDGGAAAFGETVETEDAAGKPTGYTANRGTYGVLQYARQVGVVPPAAASTLQGMAINGSEEQKEIALDTVAQLMEVNPGAASAAFPDTADRVLKDAVSFKHKVDAGIAPADAVKAVELENQAPNDAVTKGRQAQAEKNAATFDRATVMGALDTSWVPWMGDAAQLAPGAEAGVVQMFREAYGEAFLRTGDDKLARKQAAATLKGVLGTTTVGGKSVTMAYNPERYFAPALNARDPEWLNEDVTAAVQELIDAGLAGDSGDRAKKEDIAIISDSQTAREARQGLPPSYVVTWKGEVLDQRFRFDPGRAIDKANLDSELARNEARREGEARRAVAQAGYNPMKSEAQFKQMFGAADVEDFKRRTVSVEKRPKAAPAATLYEQLGTINRRYAEEATSITAKYQAKKAPPQ